MNRFLFPILLVSGVLSMTGFSQTYSMDGAPRPVEAGQ
jgi:hypothetical protein